MLVVPIINLDIPAYERAAKYSERYKVVDYFERCLEGDDLTRIISHRVKVRTTHIMEVISPLVAIPLDRLIVGKESQETCMIEENYRHYMKLASFVNESMVIRECISFLMEKGMYDKDRLPECDPLNFLKNVIENEDRLHKYIDPSEMAKGRIFTGTLYKAYENYAEESGLRPCKKGYLTKRLNLVPRSSSKQGKSYTYYLVSDLNL